MNTVEMNNNNTSSEFKNGIYKDTAGNAEVERLVAKLDSLRNDNNKQIVLISSAVINEGKSTLASHIARSSAHNRKAATLLVDFDLRRPKLHKIFQLEQKHGLVDVLSSREALKYCIKKTSIPNLFVLTSGILKKNPMEIVSHAVVRVFINDVRKCFDSVIIDSPPVIPVSDSLILGKLVDNVILVVKAGLTSRHLVQRTIDMFSDVNVSIGGIVINNMDNVLPYQYDYCSYDYEYHEDKRPAPIQKNRSDQVVK